MITSSKFFRVIDIAFYQTGIDGGLALLRSPSKALEEAVKTASSWSKQAAKNGSSCLPVLDFIQERHDLALLLTAMENASKKAAFRIYAIQVKIAISSKIVMVQKYQVYSNFLEHGVDVTDRYPTRVHPRPAVVSHFIPGLTGRNGR